MQRIPVWDIKYDTYKLGSNLSQEIRVSIAGEEIKVLNAKAIDTSVVVMPRVVAPYVH